MPQGFLTGVLQAHARKHRTPVDHLTFGFTLLDEPSEETIAASRAEDEKAAAAAAAASSSPPPPSGKLDAALGTFTPAPPPADGVLVEGLYLAGARYNRTLRELQPPRPKQMVDPLPAIHFEPIAHHTRDEADYECPLYKTSARAGTLSTTGASTNFVVALTMPTREVPDKWVRMGVAALLAPE